MRYNCRTFVINLPLLEEQPRLIDHVVWKAIEAADRASFAGAFSR